MLTLFFVVVVFFFIFPGVHILQRTGGCEWNENTDEVVGMVQYGYNGEGFLELDLKTLTWIPLKPEAAIIKKEWDTDTIVLKDIESFLTNLCPEWLKWYWSYGSSFLQRTGNGNHMTL